MVAYGLGFAGGPAIGGALSKVSLRFAAHVASLGSLCAWLLVLLAVPADGPKQAGSGGVAQSKPGWRQSLTVTDQCCVMLCACAHVPPSACTYSTL